MQVYTMPKTDAPKPVDKGGMGLPAPTAGERRILGALFPAAKPEWYFKYIGAGDQLAANEAAFDTLIKSVKLQADVTAVPAFDLPAGWTKTGPRTVNSGGIQIKTDETVRFGTPPQEITISYIPGGGLAQNLSRWAGQIGATDFDPATGTQKFEAQGVTGLRVDMRGAGKK